MVSGARRRFGAPMFEYEIFRTLLGLYGAPIVIRCPGNCSPLALSLRPCVAGAFSLWCRKGKAFCERALALYHQQHGEDKQNIELSSLEKCLRTPVLLTWIFSSFWNFSDMFWLFLTCKYNKQNIWIGRNFNRLFLCNIQSLETWNLRDRDRDSQIWVPRPRLANMGPETKPRESITPSNRLMLTNLPCSISRAWDYATVPWLRQRQTWSHGTKGWKDACEDNKWMNVECATFSKSVNPQNIEKSVSDILVCIRFPFAAFVYRYHRQIGCFCLFCLFVFAFDYQLLFS